MTHRRGQAHQAAQQQAQANFDYSQTFEYGVIHAWNKYVATAQDSSKQVEGVFANAFTKMGDSLATFVTTGKFNWRSLENDIVSGITKIAAQQLFGSMMGGVGGMMGGNGSGTAGNPGSFMGFMGMLATKFGMGTQAAAPISDASPVMNGALIGGSDGAFLSNAAMDSFIGMHSGGMVGGSATFSRFGSAGLFADAPRFHIGGIVGADEVPIIAQKGEGVFTPEQMANLAPVQQSEDGMANRPIALHIHIATPDHASFKQSRDQVGASMVQALKHAQRNL